MHNWVGQGLLVHFRTPGRHLRFQASDVRRFLSERSEPGRAAAGACRVVVVAPDRARTALRRPLRGAVVEFTDDPYTGLIQAGRLVPRLVVLDPSRFRGLDTGRYIRALEGALSRVIVVWLAATPPRGAPTAVPVKRGNLKRLAELAAAS